MDDEPVTYIAPSPFERIRDVAIWMPGLVVAVGAVAVIKTVGLLRSGQDRY